MGYKFKRDIKSNFEGYQDLIEFYHKTEEVFFDKVIVDFSCIWFDANLSAVLGAFFTKLKLKE